MPCYSPQSAFRTSGGGVTFIRSRSLSGEAFKLPCGQCIGCRLERSRQWAMRCLHERRLWRRNCFVTLTYDDARLPPGGSLVKRDFQLFMKRLRKSRRDLIRFYACGEYGETTLRPHYHAILFNCSFPDMTRYSVNNRDEVLYSSEELIGLWDNGHVLIGEVTFESAAYVARYCVKKLTGGAEELYGDRLPEFGLMSRRPGIGAGYYDRYGQEVRDHDSVVVSGRPVQPPRYYDARTKLLCPEDFEVIRKARKLRAVRMAKDNTVDRRRVKEVIARKRLEMSDKFRSR